MNLNDDERKILLAIVNTKDDKNGCKKLSRRDLFNIIWGVDCGNREYIYFNRAMKNLSEKNLIAFKPFLFRSKYWVTLSCKGKIIAIMIKNNDKYT